MCFYHCPCIQRSIYSDECLASLSLMFNKTTSLLPEGLFASLGVSRGVEGDLRGVKLVSIIFFWLSSFKLFYFIFITTDVGYRSKSKTRL